MNNLSTYATLVEKVAQQTDGIVSPRNIYSLMREIADEMGIKNVDKFISPPSEEPPEPNVQEQAMQAQAQALMMEAQASQVEAQVKVKEAEIKAAKLEIERMEVEQTLALKQEELKLKGIELGYEMSSKTNVKASG